MPYLKITENIFAVGGDGYSNPGDAYSYAVRTADGGVVLIDCGIDSYKIIVENMKEAGLDPGRLHALVLTHCHIDHIGSARDFADAYRNLRIITHSWEKDAVEGRPGTEKMTAADWYGTVYRPVKITDEIGKERERRRIGGTDFLFLHIPGHTPGSMAVIVEDVGHKVLFGQDIHGPFMREFGSSVSDWANSMKMLLAEKCDILCEGHYGIFKGVHSVEDFIKSQLRQHGF